MFFGNFQRFYLVNLWALLKKATLRYFIEIAYNGKNYFGWQRQPNEISVQEELELALYTILRENIIVFGAGRTDTGVHAKQLFAHFDFGEIKKIEKLIYRLNSLLPKDIAVRNILKVEPDSHARFHAIQREYEYYITTHKNPFSLEFAYYVHKTPNIDLMNEAAELLLHNKNFRCFSRTNSSVKTYCCNIEVAYWRVENNKLIFTISADRFLRNMVRAIVGTLLQVGYGKKTVKEFQEIIDSGRREEAGTSAPAYGLYLTKVKYPENIFIKEQKIPN